MSLFFFVFFCFSYQTQVFGAVTAEVHQKLEVLNATEKVGVTAKNI